jgi:hypothetical protein
MPQETTALAEFIHNRFLDWRNNRRKTLVPKWNANLKMIKNQDFRQKRWKKDEGEDWRSNTFLGITKVKIMTFYAIILDVVLQGGQIPFDLKPSPYTEGEFNPQQDADIEKRIEGMKDKIREQLKDRKADREYMKLFLSLAYYGMGFKKYNVVDVKRQGFRPVAIGGEHFEGMPEFTEYKYFETIKKVPGHEYRSVWNIIWDMEEDNLQEGGGVFEKTALSLYDLNQRKGKPYYLDKEIKLAMSEHKEAKVDTSDATPGLRAVAKLIRNIEAYEFWGLAPTRLVENFEREYLKKKSKTIDMSTGDIIDAEESGEMTEIMVEMVGKRIIRFKRNKEGKRPYLKGVMEEELDETTGTGIADNMEDIQFLLNGLIRAFEDNKKLSANVITALKKRYFANPAQAEEIKPGMQIDITDDCPDVRQAILPIVIPDVGETLITAIGLAERWGDSVSQIPNILQGFVLPKHKPDTAYELSQLMENAGKYIGQVIRHVDESFIEPEIWDLYKYNMQDPDVDPAIKGNFTVHAEGFTSFQNKVVRTQKMKELLALVASSDIFLAEVKIRKHLEEIYKSMDVDPDVFLKTEEEKQAEMEARLEMEERAHLAAQEAMAAEKQAEIEGKIAEEEVKSELRKNEKEEDFQRDIIKEAMGA